MYYNPETKEILDSQKLRNLLNVSFPEGIEQVQNWYLIDQNSERPQIGPDQTLIKDQILEIGGRYVQTYTIKTLPSSPLPDIDSTMEERINFLEDAMADLAQMVSNLEDYRIFYESQLEDSQTEDES